MRKEASVIRRRFLAAAGVIAAFPGRVFAGPVPPVPEHPCKACGREATHVVVDARYSPDPGSYWLACAFTVHHFCVDHVRYGRVEGWENLATDSGVARARERQHPVLISDLRKAERP